jgi:tRNA threonylcarbamoyladenosine biosynthesis protein TsaE
MSRTIELSSNNLSETISLAENIGQKLRGGEVIELVSDLGGGKTAFTKGLVKGAGSDDTARSPSFTLENTYTAGELTIHHLDFYRLADPGIMSNILRETINDPKAVIIIEWANIVKNVLPEHRLRIEILSPGENERIFKINYPEKLSYLLNLTS